MRSRTISVAAGAALSVLGATHCGGDGSGGGGGGAGATASSGGGGSSSSTTSTTSGSGGSGGAACVDAGTDCPLGSDPCQRATCVEGACGFEAIEDGPAPDQIEGDCLAVICTDGVASTELDDLDVRDDQEACTADTCSAGVPSNDPLPAGTDCSAQGPAPFHVCGDPSGQTAGSCVECNGASDCGPGESCCALGCAELSADSANCGACGHDCGGGACIEGACQPLILAAVSAGADELAVDATHLYWVERFSGAGFINKVAKSGGVVVELAASNAYNLQIDATHAYFTSYVTAGDLVLKVPLSGGSPTAILTGSFDPYPTLLASDDDTVVCWSSYFSSFRAAPKAGGASTYVASAGEVRDMVAGDGYLYWANESGIGKAPLNGAGSSVLAANPAYKLALTPQKVYFTTPGTFGGVWTVPIGGGTATAFAASTLPSDIAIHGDVLYGAFSVGIRAYPLVSGNTVLLTTQAASSVASDGEFVYWIGNGGVYKLRLP